MVGLDRDGRDGDDGNAGDPHTLGLETERLRDRYEAARALFGHESTVTLDRFAAAIRSAVAAGARADELHDADLFLALACLERDNKNAIAKLERDVIEPLRPVIERVCRNGPTLVDDVMQWTREKLLVPNKRASGDPVTAADTASAPKLAQYTGRGALLGWVRVVATREALQDRRKSKSAQQHEPTPDDAALLVGSDGTGGGGELAVLRARYASSFRSAVQAALRALTPEQRTLLRFHTHDGLTIDQLAPMLNVHRATAARRLEKARLDALEHTRRILREQHGLSESEAKSLCTALGTEVDVSIGRALSDENVSAP